MSAVDALSSAARVGSLFQTPAETARQARFGNVAFIGFISGVLMSFSGLIFGLIRVVRSTKRIRRALAAVQDVDPSEKVDEG